MIKDDLNIILDRNIQWINNCDTKSSILLGFIGLIISFVFNENFFKKQFFYYIFNNISNLILIFFLIISLIFIMIGIGFSILSIKATISTDFKENGLNMESLIYFSTIINNNYNEYKNKVLNLKEESLCDEIISQIYITSIICDKKFKNYNQGLKYSTIGLVSLIIIVILMNILI